MTRFSIKNISKASELKIHMYEERIVFRCDIFTYTGDKLSTEVMDSVLMLNNHKTQTITNQVGIDEIEVNNSLINRMSRVKVIIHTTDHELHTFKMHKLSHCMYLVNYDTHNVSKSVEYIKSTNEYKEAVKEYESLMNRLELV